MELAVVEEAAWVQGEALFEGGVDEVAEAVPRLALAVEAVVAAGRGGAEDEERQRDAWREAA